MTIRKTKARKKNQKANSKEIAIRLKPTDLSILYKRLHLFGYNTLDELLAAFIAGKCPAKMEAQYQIALVDYDFFKVKFRKLMAISGSNGLAIKVALLSGLRTEEILYLYSQETCEIQSCQCHKLHVIERPSGLSVVIINWFHNKQRCYVAILPTRLLTSFRSLFSFGSSDIANADKVAQQAARLDFDNLQKIFASVMRKTMDARQVDVLTGKADLDTANDVIAYELDSLVDKYCEAWEKVCVVLPVL